MELNIYKVDGTKTRKKVTLNSDVFEVEPNDHVLYLAVKAHLANKRQGTHSVKTRSVVRGGGRKPFRQKGTGRARQGTTRSPHMPGGGRAHGPHPRDYSQDLPKKVKKLARRSALSYKAKENKILVVEDFQFDAPKTRRVAELLENLGVNDRKVLILTGEYDVNLYKSARNIPYKSVLKAPQFSTYDVLNANALIIQNGAVKILNEVLAK